MKGMEKPLPPPLHFWFTQRKIADIASARTIDYMGKCYEGFLRLLWNIYIPLCPCYLLLYDYQAMPVAMINRAFPDALCLQPPPFMA